MLVVISEIGQSFDSAANLLLFFIHNGIKIVQKEWFFIQMQDFYLTICCFFVSFVIFAEETSSTQYEIPNHHSHLTVLHRRQGTKEHTEI